MHALIGLCLCTWYGVCPVSSMKNHWCLFQVVQRFQELFSQSKYKEAAELAAESPQGILRTPDTVAKFQVFLVQSFRCFNFFSFFVSLSMKIQ
jgi:hypothetical protein